MAMTHFPVMKNVWLGRLLVLLDRCVRIVTDLWQCQIIVLIVILCERNETETGGIDQIVMTTLL